MKHQQQQQIINRQVVLELTTWSEQQLNDFIFNCAYTYMRRVLKLNDACVRAYANDKEFWAWWADEWDKRDNEDLVHYLIGAIAHGQPMVDFQTVYQGLHSYYNLEDLRPTNQVLKHINKTLINA